MTSLKSDVKIIASRSSSLDGSIDTNSDPMQTLQKELERYTWSNAEGKNAALKHLGAQKRMKTVTSSSQENIRKISKQFLYFWRYPCPLTMSLL